MNARIRFTAWGGVKALLVLCFLAVAALTVWNLQAKVQDGMTQNQLRTLDMATEKTTENMRTYFQEQWDLLEFSENNLHERSFDSAADLLAAAGAQSDSLAAACGQGMLLLIDSEGFYYAPGVGKVAPWRSANTAFASSDLEFDRKVSLNTLAELDGIFTEYLCFALKMGTPLQAADGATFTHMVLATSKNVFDVDLSLKSFGEISDAFVMDSQGRKVNAQALTSNLAKSYNLMAALSEAEYLLGDSYEAMVDALGSEGEGISLVRIDEGEYYISYRYMGVEDWYAVLMVDKKSMNSIIEQLTYEVAMVLSLGFLVMALLAGIYLIITARRNILAERRVAAQLKESSDEAKRANQAKSQFLSRMSHDIRTPINGILGMTRIADICVDDPTAVKRCLDKIRSASEHLLELVNEVLDISRIESGKTEVTPKRTDLLAMLGVVNDIVESKLSNRKVAYEEDLSGISHTCVMVDTNLVKQVLINLLDNAVKYTPDGGAVRFCVTEESATDAAATYRFKVSDTGIGMEKEFLEHIFERFSQEGISARSSYEGTGLGMAIVKDLVTLMGGTIDVESEKGVGTAFDLVLTFALCEEAEDEAGSTGAAGLGAGTAESAASRNASGGPLHVLLAEDNDVNREIAEFMLHSYGLDVTSVENGKELLAEFAASEPGTFDAILTDIRMPLMDGLEATRAVRALERPDAARVPIVAMTANAYGEDRDASMEAGMNAHLTKPLDGNVVLSTITELCRKAKAQENGERK